ncbi:MAG TPA: hypothetical protein VGN42_11480, partial [Pirellulales bacterium]|nr:hypothetical protein [Pirellulales bacterium]
MAPSGVNLTPAEGLAFSGAVATFAATDVGPFNATIDWGDGSTTEGTISSNSGVYTVAGSHTYADEGTDPVSVAIIDAADSTTAAVTSTATVGESDSLTPSPGQFTVTGMEGMGVNANVALFADPGYPTNAAADFTSTIDWGDGATSAGTVSGPATTALDMFSQPGDWVGGGAAYHFTPATGSFFASSSANDSQISFSYSDPGLNQWWDVELAAPNGGTLVPGVYDNAARAAFHPPNQPGLEVSGDGRGSNTLTGSFTIMQAVYDASGHVLSFDATFVQHSEGAAAALTGEIKYKASGGSYTVSGAHTYADDGSYKITAILADDAPGTASATATATAEIASALALSPSASTLNTTEGTTATAVLGLITNSASTEPASDYLATINWGDGTTAVGAISGAAGAYTVAGSHAYAKEGDFTISVTAREASDPTAILPTVTLIAQVADGDLLVGAAAPIAATEGAVFTGAALATFADSGYPNNDPADFVATIEWGDGTTAIGNVSTAGDGTFTVGSNHIYADEGTHPIAVTLADAAPGAASATATATATVVEGDALAAGPSVTASAAEGSVFNGAVATFADGDANNLPADFTSMIDWGDGATSAGTVNEAATTSLDMHSQPGDYIGAGAAYHLTPATGAFGVSSRSANDSQITFNYQEPNLGQWWYVEFAAPNGTTLVPGVYEGAARAAFHPPNQPGLDVSGDGRGSNTLTGSFTITEAVYDASGNVLRFDATFVQHSEGAAAALTGEIKYNAVTGTFTVSGSHTYASDGVYAITTRLAEDAPGTASASASATADVASAMTLSPPNAPFAATEGATASGVVALISGPVSTDPANDFLATIDWGDGTTTAGAVTGAAGSYTVAGSHVYSDEGGFTVTVSALEAGAPSAPAVTATLGVQVADRDSLVGAMAPIAATEGATFTGAALATFSDAGSPNNNPTDFAAFIDWGDGSTTAGTVTTAGDGSFTVSGNHLYADEGSFPVKAILNDDAPGVATATATTTATVADADILAAGPSVTAAAAQGAVFIGTVATFGDSGYPNSLPANFAATIDWGDGTTTAGTVTSQASGALAVSGVHAYAKEGAFDMKITLADAAPGMASATASATANVAGVVILLPPNSPFAATEGTTATGAVALISDPMGDDPASDFLATIDWGDGTTTAGTVTGAAGSYTVAGSHVYSDEGDFMVFVSAQEAGAPSALAATLEFSESVAEGDSLVGAMASIAATEGAMFTGAALATFSDAGYPDNNPTDFAAFIDWGDGSTTAGTATTAGDGAFTVSGNHLYADEGSFPVKVTLADDASGAATATATTAATVADVDVLAAGPDITVNVKEGTAFSGIVGTFDDSGNPNNLPTNFTATIDWGDGTTASGHVTSQPSGEFAVSGRHTYADEGTFGVKISLAENAPGTAVAATMARVVVGDADQTINYPDFANTAGLTLNGRATQTGNALRLTDGGLYEAGAAFFNAPIDLTHSFQTQFTFEQHGGSNPPADGLAFVTQNSTSGAQALGRDGGDVGYGGIA